MSDVINAPAAEVQVAARILKNHFEAVVPKCIGCNHLRLLNDVGYCSVYARPSSKWTVAMCNFATHAKLEKSADAKFVNPLKASKRGGG